MAESDKFFDQPTPNQGEPTQDEKNWGLFSHLGFVVGFIIPFGAILTPLVIWLTQREKSAFVEDQAKESLNFQISLIIVMIPAVILCFIPFLGLLFLLGLIALGIAALVFSIMAAVAASKGERYRYPVNFRLIK